MKAIQQLRGLGFVVRLQDKKIHYDYTGDSPPPKGDVVALLDTLRGQKEQAEGALRIERLTMDTFRRQRLGLVIDSKLVGERILLVYDQEAKARFHDEPEVIYTFDEALELMKLSEEGRDEALKKYHLAKKAVDGTVTEIRMRLQQEQEE